MKVPNDMQEQFVRAIRGEREAQEWIDEYTYENKDLWWLSNDLFPYIKSKPAYKEEEVLYHIGLLYYQGDDYREFNADKEKAFTWFKLSAEKGNSNAAVWAGDMLRYGEGAPADEQAAYELYCRAVAIEPNGDAFERIGDCYAAGIGTKVNRKKATDYYLDSAILGHAAGLYRLSNIAEDKDINRTALYKAASSRNETRSYLTIGYRGADGYSAVSAKHDLVDRLLEVWDSENDGDPAIESGAAPIKKPDFSKFYGYFGLFSADNINDYYPIGDNVVQFWTHEYDGVTYTVTLQRFGLLYTLRIFEMRNGEVHLVSNSLYFDEMQGVEISFPPHI